MRLRVVIALGALLTLSSGRAETSPAHKPAALTGSRAEIKALRFDVTSKNRIIAKDYEAKDGGLPVGEYARHAVVAILETTKGFNGAALWKTADQCATVEAYLAKGGKLLLGGTTATELSALSSEAKKIVDRPDVTKIATPLWIQRFEFARAGVSLGEADEQGNYILTPAGETVAALVAQYRDAIMAAKDLDISAEPNEWEAKPLGVPGDRRYDTAFRHEPKLVAALPRREPGIVLYDGANKAVIVAPKGDKELQALADELAWHLGEMTGVGFDVLEKTPTKGVAVELKRDEGPMGRTWIRREGDRLVIGGSLAGPSHGVTYLLEALGCRYLWPGKGGKVIPRGLTRIIAPEISLDATPVLKVREIRDYGRGDAKYKDRPGNRGFFAWHGLNDHRDLDGYYQWGHFFADYYQKHFKQHPDWFALQPNGERAQDLASRPERPALCLSSEGLVRQAAQDIIADFRRYPNMKAHSICLPDGGNPSECMCRRCRALDPANGATVSFRVTEPWHRSFKYVSFTDRVMTFNNRIAELVTKEIPYAKLTCYVYSNYVDPPLKVTPHPALILLSVAGWYSTPEARERSRKNIAAWSTFGNPIMWRPNAFKLFHAAVPQNFARAIFSDLETYKANGVYGTDFDCMSDHWATAGLVYYMTAKAHLNFDAVGYDAWFDDYCEKGFGNAAPQVKEYFTMLEQALAESGKARSTEFDYLRRLDVDALDALLAAGEKAAAGDADSLARVQFLRKAIPIARVEKEVYAGWETKDVKKTLDAQAAFDKLMAETPEDPLVFTRANFKSGYEAPKHVSPRFKDSSPVQDLLDGYTKKGRVSGVVSILSDADYSTEVVCSGYADLERKRPMATNTVFAIFSMTKTITGAAIMCAIDEGKFSLDDRVSKYLPEYAGLKMEDGSKPKRELTIRDLTCHIDGMRWEYPLVNTDIPLREAARLYAVHPAKYQPGETFEYGTMRFSVAAAALEVAIGERFEDYLKRKVLDPLGMKDTTFTPNVEQLSRLVKAYTSDDKPLRPASDNCSRQLAFPKEKPLCPAPGGGLFSTPADVIRFSQMLAHHGTWKGKAIISRKTFDEVFAVIQVPGELGSKNPYSVGSWIYGDWFGHEGAMRTDQRANLRTGQCRLFFLETENKAGSAFFSLKRDWQDVCDAIQGTPHVEFGH